MVEDRAIHTRYARATETTDRLRDDGGAYLRLWDERMAYYHAGLHARLVAGGAEDMRDCVALRRAAGHDGLPFYCRRRLPCDARGREVYDNAATRHLDYYVPDGAPVPDDLYEAVVERGDAAAARARPTAPRIESAPAWGVADGPLTVSWRYADGDAIERLSRRALGGDPRPVAPSAGASRLRPAAHELHGRSRERLRDSGRYAVVVYARGDGGFSGSAVAPFLYRPAPDEPLLDYNPLRPRDLSPDAGAHVPPGLPVPLFWDIADPELTQARATVAVFEDVGCLAPDARRVFACELEGAHAAACRCAVPAAVVRPGHTYYWYVTPTNAGGHAAFAPVEGVFTVDDKG